MTNIKDKHREFFENMGDYSNLGLFSCFVDGEPTAAICTIDLMEDGDVSISPFLVFVTDKMVLTDHDGRKTITKGEVTDEVHS